MAYRLNTMGGTYLLPDFGPAEAAVPSLVGNMLHIAKFGMYVVVGGMEKTVYVRCESIGAEPPLGDEWEDVMEVSVVPLEYPVGLPESEDGKVFKPSGALAADPEVHNWRLRINSTGRQSGYDRVPRAREEFLLQTWPALPSPPAVLRKTSTFTYPLG